MNAPDVQPAPPPRELSAEETAYRVPPDALPFATTAEVSTPPEWTGQERALAALEMGVRVGHPGYNIYVCGLGGTHREQTLAKLLAELTKTLPRPGDRVLVQNFQNRDRPRAFYLPAGQGKQTQGRDAERASHETSRVPLRPGRCEGQRAPPPGQEAHQTPDLHCHGRLARHRTG